MLTKHRLIGYALVVSSFFFVLNSTTQAHKINAESIEYTGLSIDGIGVKSVVSLKYLDALDEEIKKESHERFGLGDVFDYVGGTSTGALIALAVALKKDLSAVLALTDFGRLLPKTYGNWFYQLYGARFSGASDDFQAYLKEIFGESKLSDLNTRVITTSVDSKTFRPHFFRRKKSGLFRRSSPMESGSSFSCCWLNVSCR